MSPTGWLTMIVSIGGVLAAAAWAYYKVCLLYTSDAADD